MVIFAVSLAISCIIITFLSLNSQYRSRKALLWWQTRQWMRMQTVILTLLVCGFFTNQTGLPLSPELRERIQSQINNLAIEARPTGVKKLKNRENGYRIKVGNYRILYDIFDALILIIIVEVGHRSKIYKDKS
jgi:mRNA interferase RelE/StbE